jgi:hypothetical protein
LEAEPNTKKGKKIFKKNISCPYEGCSNGYSSKIALNSHIRSKHIKKTGGTVELQTPECQLSR